MRVSDKIDWLEFSLMYTKDDSVNHDAGLLTETQVHYSPFGDRLIRALYSLGTEDFTDEMADLLRKFGQWCLPREYYSYFDFTKWERMRTSVKGYASTFQVGDPAVRTFLVRVPMRLATDSDVEHGLYMIEHPRTRDFYVYNALVGFRIVITGHNIPFERKKLFGDYNLGTICPVRFHVPEWVVRCQEFNTLMRIGRIDVALDVEYHFCYFAKLFQDHPEAFKLPHFKDHRRLEYNPFNGSGCIYSGVRGKGNDNYLRIYNKAAEQGDCIDFYPWDDPLSARVESPVSTKAKKVYERPWTRFEFELRGACAMAFLTTYFDSIYDDTNIGEFVLVNIGVYSICSDQDLKYVSYGNYLKLSFSKVWQDVVDSYQKYGKAQNQNFVQFREELPDKNFSVSAVGIRMAYNVSPYRTGFKKLRDCQRVLNNFVSSVVRPDVPDFLHQFALGCSSGKNIVDFVRTVPTDFLDAANKAKFEDLKRFCGASDERCRDILNRAGLKGYSDEIFKKLNACSVESVPDHEDDTIPYLSDDLFNVGIGLFGCYE